jgi:hypothetical protein
MATVVLIVQPRAVSENDDKELANMMADLEVENKEVRLQLFNHVRTRIYL